MPKPPPQPQVVESLPDAFCDSRFSDGGMAPFSAIGFNFFRGAKIE
jgi:hypothetical protein